jgi:hypothetical protein
VNVSKWLRQQWDRAAAWAFALAGAIALILGWLGVSSHGYPAQEIPYVVSGGLGGIFLLGVGATLWLSADLRDEWGKLNRIERQLGEMEEALNNLSGAASNSPADVDSLASTR